MSTRIFATGFDDYIDEDRPALYVRSGFGNNPPAPEVHLEFQDPATGAITLLGWFDAETLITTIKKETRA